jgi:hypothetical protein
MSCYEVLKGPGILTPKETRSIGMTLKWRVSLYTLHIPLQWMLRPGMWPLTTVLPKDTDLRYICFSKLTNQMQTCQAFYNWVAIVIGARHRNKAESNLQASFN